MPNLIDHSLANGILKIKLNRPDKLNSFNRAMSLELIEALKQAALDPAVRAVILTGEGRGFCAGQDLADALPKDKSVALNLGEIVRDCYNPAINLIRSTEKPFIAAVNGVAAGAGANLAFACDFVVAATDASFIQSFSKVGLIPDSGGTFMLPRLVGMARATALTMLGEKLSAQRALEIGLIYAVAEPAQLQSQAAALAGQLAQLPTRGLGLTKRAFNASLSNTLQEQLAMEESLQREAGYTADFKEGVSAFLEKRPPNFLGR